MKINSKDELNRWWAQLNDELRANLSRELSMDNGEIDIQKLKSQKVLTLIDIEVPDFSLLTVFDQIQYLHLLDIKIGSGFRSIKEFQELKELFLTDVEYEETIEINVLNNLQNLEIISISDSFGDVIYYSFENLSGLKVIEWSDSGIEKIPKLPLNLKKLYLDDTKVSDLSPLINLKDSLEFVYCHRCRVTKEHLDWIEKQMPNTYFETKTLLL